MAKNKPLPISPGAENDLHLLRIEYYVRLVAQAYEELIEEFAAIAATLPSIKPNKVFNFSDYPLIKSRLNRAIDKTNFKVINVINQGIDDAWERSAKKNDDLVERVLQKSKLKKTQVKKFFNRNLEALAESRTPISKLSPRVFNITKQFQFIAEHGIDSGVGTGRGARKLARDIRMAVKDPDFTFKRVRNEKGVLVWSKNAQKFKRENPGASGVGVYLNPQKNFERLTRTEINRSYRQADQTRYKQLDFVVGVRINLSNNPNHCPMCEALAGDYPKGFFWAGWHPQCRCYMTTILKTDTEIEADNVRILQGKEPLKLSSNSVKNMPKNYNEWIAENKERLQAAIKRDKKPYWIRDAYIDGDFEKGLKLK